MEHTKQLFYIHGGESFNTDKDFLEYLKNVEIEDPAAEKPKKRRWTNELREEMGENWEVFMPTMPNKYNSRYEEWKIWFERHFEWLRDGVVLLGWSQGGSFFAKYLVENETPFTVKALFLVAAPFEQVDWYGENGRDFAFDTKKVGDLAKKAEKVFILHSEDDPVVPFTHAVKYHEGIPGSTLISFKDRNHFLIEEFPELIEQIKSLQ